MKIKIAQRLRPFSHTPGASCVIPGTHSVIQAFPTRIKIDDHLQIFPLSGPVKDFTLQLDLEKSCVFVFGKAAQGYFRLKIQAKKEGIEVVSEKGPIKSFFLEKKFALKESKERERLSLGSHKAQDFDHLRNKGSIKEILQLFFSLGQQIPKVKKEKAKGLLHLLELPSDRNELEESLANFINAGFESILVPKVFDDHYLGLCSDEKIEGSPFILIQEGYHRLRSLFIQERGEKVALLPHLPTDFDAGRMIDVSLNGIGKIDFEWSKKLIKKVIIKAEKNATISLDIQKQVKTFRFMKKHKKDKNSELVLEAGKNYILDRFEK